MSTKMTQFQHPDSIWTWKSNHRGKKASLWIPYLKSVQKAQNCPKDHYEFSYSGGKFISDLSKVDCIMLYGPTGELSVEFLDRLSSNSIQMLIHRRNVTKPYIFLPGYGAPTSDVLTRQIAARENEIKRTYIARTLIAERLKTIHHTAPIPSSKFKYLRGLRGIDEIRALEAQTTKRYWSAYYRKLGVSGLTRRDDSHPINSALDAGSFFLFGILLRWVMLHRLSPWHGYMHQPVSYAALCYDLMEPYRYMIESAVEKAWEEGGSDIDSKTMTALSLRELKESLKEIVYVRETRQFVARKNLLHGVVLALRAYLLGDSRRLLIPTEGDKKSGRPLSSGYSIPGARPEG